MSKKKNDWVSQEKGHYNMVKISRNETGTFLNFEYDLTNDEMVETQFCEIGELSYVAESYFRSAIQLISKVDEIESETEIKKQYNLSFYFLPAMFCFRHYVELKLKIIFLQMKKDKFYITHNLKEMKDEIENMGFTKHCFDEAIELIDSYENGQVELFRYLLNKTNNEFTNEIKIQHKTKEKMLKFYRQIEYYTNIYFGHKFIEEILKKP